MQTTHVVLTAVLALLLSPASAQRRESSPVSAQSEVDISSEEDVLAALRGLEDGETLKLGVREVKLNATLQIAASHIVIAGARGMTRVRCPPGGSAFAISGTNVTLSGLSFSRCQNASAVRLRADRENPGRSDPGDPESDTRDQGKQERTASIRNCVFRQNRAWKGAAVRASRYRLEIDGTFFEDNQAILDGGALHVFHGEVTVENSVFRNCTTKKGDGGAIRAEGTRRLTVLNSLFSRNSATARYGNGGGLAVEGCRRMNVSNSTFVENSAGQDGGGFVVFDAAGLTVVETVFTNNSAEFGGCIRVARITDLTIKGSTFLENRADYGGCVHAVKVTNMTLQGSTFSENWADYGGCIRVVGTTDLRVQGSIFSGNRADHGGSVHAVNVDSLLLEGVTFSENRAEFGGSVRVVNATDLTVEGSTFSKNQADHGGCVHTLNVASVKVEGSTFSKNRAEFGGCVRAVNATDLTVEGSTFSRNQADHGGSVHTLDVANVTVEGSTFSENRADYGESVRAVNVTNVSVEGSTFSDNRAGDTDGGFAAWRCEDATGKNSASKNNAGSKARCRRLYG